MERKEYWPFEAFPLPFLRENSFGMGGANGISVQVTYCRRLCLRCFLLHLCLRCFLLHLLRLRRFLIHLRRLG